MKYEFNRNHKVIKTISDFQKGVKIKDMEKEQGMYSATPEFCRKHGGPITKKLLEHVPIEYLKEASQKGLYPNIDVRIQRLYPGNYPAYPGWHCDAQFRETYFGQPKTEMTQLSNHLIATVSTDEYGISTTEFIDEEITIDIDHYDPTEGEPFWKIVDTKIRQMNEAKKLSTWTMPQGQLTTFDCWTLHHAKPATKRGWRLFFRVSMWYRPNLEDGKLSKQESIYIDINQPTGW